MKNKLPGWEIVNKISSGGFSTVYKIKKVDSAGMGDYYAALKIIKIPGSSEEYDSYVQEGYDEETIKAIFSNQVKKLEDEIRILARFKGNSDFVSYEDHMVISEENCWEIYIRMELLTPFTEYCKEKKLSDKEAIRLGIEMCRALELCHGESIIHRDIKPQNIFVNDFGKYKLGDFGIAKTMNHATYATRTGTYSYMSPEVYNGEKYDQRVDIYSLGLVLYWMLNDRRLPFMPPYPIVVSADDLNEASSRRIKGERIPLPKNGSEDLKRIVLKACEFNPDDRFENATIFKKELEKLLNINELQEPRIKVDADENIDDFEDDYEEYTSDLNQKSNRNGNSGGEKILTKIFSQINKLQSTINGYTTNGGGRQKIKSGSTIAFGKYYTKGSSKDEIAPIEWCVLDVIDKKALIISKYTLDCLPYNDKLMDTEWKTSYIRSWLNDTFYNFAFSDFDKNKIIKTKIRNSKNQRYSTSGGESTIDNVFLLSVDEAKAYFSSNKNRVGISTEYAQNKGVGVNSQSGASWWWLRTPGKSPTEAAFVNSMGDIDEKGISVTNSIRAVRPALWINIE